MFSKLARSSIKAMF
ncbi:TPA: hypothetical protein NWA23_001751 [Escherichia coli]|nr:hypothetical protein [Escherichia coli]